jgi:hypothetical protein
MSFKECLEKDITVFLNIKEFGEEHILDDHKIAMIIDEDIINERQNRKRATEYVEGLFAKEISLFVRSIDLPEIPVHGQMVILDGKKFFVNGVFNSNGVTEIELVANES